ncbi:MAG: glycosyltransferase family 39 protein [Candidatus Micrarchaeia archaeon]
MIIGYTITTSVLISFVVLIFAVIFYRKNLNSLLKKHINKYTLLGLVLILAFFISLMLIFIHPVEQLFFDENIYQGIALNIVHSGNSLWCQYGTGLLTHCYSNQLYHDPVGIFVFLGIVLMLFGPGPQTAYNFQLFIGILSIIGVFLLSSIITERKALAPISTFIFSLIPEVIIWSRTQAAPDLYFMMFTTFSFFFFIVFTKNENKTTLILFLSSLSLAFYSRIESFLLMPIFIILYFIFGDAQIKVTIKKRAMLLKRMISDYNWLIILLFFFLIFASQGLYIYLENQSPQYGQASNQSVISISNFKQNITPNAEFLLGTTTNYPSISSINLLALAILGFIFIIIFKRIKNRLGIFLMLILSILLFFIFYTSFYAGSVNYGVDVRFMLELMPFIAIAAGFGVLGLTDIVYFGFKKLLKVKKEVFLLILSTILIITVIIPFYLIIPYITIPVNEMPQEYFNTQATSFIYNNYQKVPTSCLVFSFTPDIWYELNRSAAQVSYMSELNSNTSNNLFKNYSCFVFDYGYWCTVSEFSSSTCGSQLFSYNTSVLATERNSEGSNFTLYKINNATSK